MTYDQNPRGQDGSFSRARDEVQAGINHATEKTRQQAKQTIENNRDRAAGGMESMAHAFNAAAEDLREHDQVGLSHYVSDIAESVGSVADSLRRKSVDELAHEVQALARNNPTLFIAGSLAIGLGLGRFARASSRHSHGEDTKHGNDSASGWGGSYSSDSASFDRSSYDSEFSSQGDAYPEVAAGYYSESVSDENYPSDDLTDDDSLTSRSSAANSELSDSADDAFSRSEISGQLNTSEKSRGSSESSLSTRDKLRSSTSTESNTGAGAKKPANTNPFGGDVYE